MKNNIITINENIHKITLPYKDIFTTVCTVSTKNGTMLFDAASYDEDVENYIIPMLDSCIEPIEKVKKLVKDNFSKSDIEIRAMYNQIGDVPTLSTRLITAVRETINNGQM